MTSTILRPEILVIGNRSYRINPSSLPGLESANQQHREVYREEDESDYYLSKNDTYDDEPSCIPKRTHPPQEIEAPPVSIGKHFPTDKINYKKNLTLMKAIEKTLSVKFVF